MEHKEYSNTLKKVVTLAVPVIEELGLELWDAEFKKEGASWFLRFFIDKENGVSIEDCENVSRALDKILDESDPIEQQYYLEVSSPGIERELKTDVHFKKYEGSKIFVKLFKALDGQKEFEGNLISKTDGKIFININDNTVCFEQSNVALVKLSVEF